MALIMCAVTALYIPGVLNTVASRVFPQIEKASGLRIQVADIRLKFPLRLSLHDAIVIDTATADTMITAAQADASVAVLPLITGAIEINSADVRHAYYRMGGPDSLYISARIDTVSAGPASLRLGQGIIDVNRAAVAGANVRLIMGDSATAEKTDTVPPSPLTVRLGKVTLDRINYSMRMSHPADSAATDTVPADTIAAGIKHAALSHGQIRILPSTLTINAQSVTLDADHGLYGKCGAEPMPGLDMNWLEITGTHIRVDSFSMNGTDMRVPVSRLHTRERCGLTLDATGTFAMDSTSIRTQDFRFLTPRSSILLDAVMGTDTVPAAAPLSASLKASIDMNDITLAMPLTMPVTSALPAGVPLRIKADVTGTMAGVTVDTLRASMQRIFAITASGYARDFTTPDDMVAEITLDGSLTNPGPLQKMVKGITLPPISLKGKAKANRGKYTADIKGRTGSGRLALDGTYSGTAPDYTAKVRLDSFPVSAFMPDLGIGTVTAALEARGHGFNPMSRATRIDAHARIHRLTYRRSPVTGVTLDASLGNGNLTAALHSDAPAADLDMNLTAGLAPALSSWDLNAQIRHLNLRALGLTDSVMNGSLSIVSTGWIAPRADSIGATAALTGINWNQGSINLRTDSVRACLRGTPAHTAVRLKNLSLDAALSADTSFTALLESLSAVSATASSQIAARSIHADTLHSILPPLSLTVSAGPDNLAADFLRSSGISYSSFSMHAANDTSLHTGARLLGLTKGETLRIDTVNLDLRQQSDALIMAADIGNRPGTFDNFARVGLRAGMKGNRLKAYIRQQNILGQTGYSIGFTSEITDSLINVSLEPLDPVIAYKNWTINEGNYISFNPGTFHIDANLDASGDASRVQLFTSHNHHIDSDGHPATANNDLTMRITDVKLQDWLSINPFAPPVAGTVSADLNLVYDSSSLNGTGNVNLSRLTYGKEPVGDFDLALDVSTNRSGVINAEVALMVDSIKTITAVGALNDSTKASPFLLDFTMIKMPLKIANPFLPKDMARLSGTLNGAMEITGNLANPVFNGYLDFDEASVRVDMIGSSFRFSEEKIPVDSNVVRFDAFTIAGSNDHPLNIDGTVDMRSISSPAINLAMSARDMQVIDSKKRKNVDVYGKAYIDLNATVKGNLNFLAVDADVALLPRTDVTYIVSSAESRIGLQNTSDMVRFVNFADSAAVAMADSVKEKPSMALMIDASLDVRQGSTITADLSTDGQNRVQIQGDGILSYTQTPVSADGRLTGRFTINNGFVRYSLPVISEKHFDFVPGSYVSFNGPMLNPVLSVKAVDQVRANVTRQGENSRLVNFDITLSVSGTLEQMNVAFDLSTNDDITVQNELRSMSAEQRANQAMNLMLYNVYSGPGTSASANLSGNPLYSFLTSQLNTWAANTIKGVDVSFGLDQYDSTRNGTTTQTTSYSYKVSKSLFNNRFKIVVGGNYSTDANPDENLSQNLISDVSFEYLLNESGSMYVRLFRHTGFESILEGEVTQTGVGFVLKRKLRRLSDIFRFRQPQPFVKPKTPSADNK